MLQMKFSYFFIKFSAQTINSSLVILVFGPKFHLGQSLISERVAHNETGVTSSTSQIHQATFSQHNNTFVVTELPASHHILDHLFLHSRNLGQACHIDFIVKVTDIANNSIIFHFDHILSHDNITVTCGSDKYINLINDLFFGDHTIALHTSLECANRVYFSYIDDGILSSHGGSTSFSHISVAENKAFLAGDHHIASSVQTIGEGVTTSVDIIKLGFGDRVVHIDAGAKQSLFFF